MQSPLRAGGRHWKADQAPVLGAGAGGPGGLSPRLTRRQEVLRAQRGLLVPVRAAGTAPAAPAAPAGTHAARGAAAVRAGV